MTKTHEKTVADSMLRSLKRNGVDYLFANLGSDHPPILEALARNRAEGRFDEFPELVVCPHEFAAASAAHGYTAVTGDPQGVLVHVDVGTTNVAGAIHNAHRANVPMFVLAGLAPVSERGFPGSRDTTVHYVQDIPDQLELVDQYCRWSTEYRLPADPDAVVRRGLQRATANPQGPVYVGVAREALEATQYSREEGDRARSPDGSDAPIPPTPVLNSLASRIERSNRPVVLTSSLGQTPSAVGSLISFAETAGAGVIEHRPTALNFPRDHELHLGYEPAAVFAEADLLLVTASDVPWIPASGSPSDDCQVVQLERDPSKPTYPLWNFPVDVAITASPGKTLTSLADLIDPDAGGSARNRWAERSAKRREKQAAKVADHRDRGLLTPAGLSNALRNIVTDSTIIVDDAVTSKQSVLEQLPLSVPGSYHMKGGSALGWAPGAAVGVKMADPEARVIALTGDGAYVFSNPTASTWLAENQNAPVLTVIYDNGGWNAVNNATTSQHPDGHSAGEGVPESRFSTELDLSVPARSVGAYTRRVSTYEELQRALGKAVDEIERGNPATIDVRLESI